MKNLKDQWLRHLGERKTNEDLTPETFYCQNISPRVAEKLREENPHLDEGYESLIALLGFTPETVVISALCLKPKNLLVLHNEDSSRYLDLVYMNSGLPMSRFQHMEVDCSSIESIIEQFNKALNRVPDPRNSIVEVTSGEKSMAIAVAMAAAIRNMDICFLSYDKYISPKLRKPDPESMFFTHIKNPAGSFLDILGGPEVDRAISLFNVGEYYTATQLFQDMENRMSETRTPELAKTISLAYHHWDKFNFQEAIEPLERALNLYRSFEHLFRKKFLFNFEAIEKQLEILKGLAAGDLSLMLLNCYFSAIREEQRGRLDIAALLFYRAIEMAYGNRLKKLFPKLELDNPDYSIFDIDEQEMLSRFNEIGLEVSKAFNRESLPEKIALIDSVILLKIIEDRLVEKANLSFIKHLIKSRNYSIYAHGYEPINARECQKLRRFAKEVITKTMLLEDGPETPEALKEAFTFICAKRATVKGLSERPLD